MTARFRRAGGMAAILALATVVTGCGQPSAQLIQAGDGPVTFELPVDYTDLSPDDDLGAVVYGPPGSSTGQLGEEPVVFLVTAPSGDTASFQGLRRIATGNQFDPLDPELETLPAETTVLGYAEINEPEVWGIRLRLVVGAGAKDFQALVHRQSDEVIITEVACTQSCFAEQLDVIQQIQGSWSLES